MVGRVSVDLTIPEGVGFTVRCSCRFATYPYWSRIRGLNSYYLLGGQRCYHYTNTTYKNKINLILLCGQVYDWYPHFLLPESCYCLSNHFLQPCAARRTLSHSNPELYMSSESDIVNFNGSFTEIRTRIDNLMRIVWEPNP